MIELCSVEFPEAASLFQDIDHSIAIVGAVLETNSPGRVFVDDAQAPSVVLLHAVDGFFYVAGDQNHKALEQSLLPLVFHEILPKVMENELILFSFSHAWRSRLDVLLSAAGAIQISRKVFKFSREKFALEPDWRAGIPEGYCLREIDRQMADRYPAYQPLVDPATKRWGVCLMQGDEVVGECSAVFVGGGEAEIDIHTHEPYRGRGFARLTARAFIETCLARGLRPNWSCWPQRSASWALARRLGFEEQPDVPAHYCPAPA